MQNLIYLYDIIIHNLRDGMAMAFSKKTLVIPDNTIFEEHCIVAKGDIIVGDRCNVHYGFITQDRIFIGGRAKIFGNISANEEIRVDMFSYVCGNINCQNDVYLGERVKVEGRVFVGKDLDVGENVEVKEFSAKGWINIRNPLPLIIYIFIYILELLRQGRSKQVEKILKELEKIEGNEELLISENFLFIPNDSVITSQRTRISGNAKIGNKCRIIGNFIIGKSANIGNETEIYGSLRTNGNIVIGERTTIQGNVECKGILILKEQSRILGNIKAKRVEMFKNAFVNGTIQAEKIKFNNELPKE